MKKRDLEQLAEIALRANAGDEAQLGKMAKHLWRVRRWAAEQTWRAKDGTRGGILEQISTSLDGALHALEDLKAHGDGLAPGAPASIQPAPTPTTVIAPAPPMPPSPPEAPEPDAERRLTPKGIEDQVALAVDVAKRGVIA